jgi:hypothetical protein
MSRTEEEQQVELTTPAAVVNLTAKKYRKYPVLSEASQ